MKPFRRSAIRVLVIVFLTVPLWTVANEIRLAVSLEGPVTDVELQALLEQSLDSEYAATAADYLSTGGLKQAVADIVLERRIARMARKAGIADKREVAARIRAVERDVLIGLAQDDLQKKILISDEEIRNFYQSNIREYTRPEQVQVHLYMLPRNGQESSAGRATMERLRRKLTASHEQDNLAGFEVVTSGAVVVRAGDFPDEVQERIFNARVGSVTEVIERKHAWYLAQILDHQTTQVTPLEQVAPQVRQHLFRTRLIERQKRIEADLESSFPLTLHPIDKLPLSAEGSQVVAEVSGTSITLADVAADLSQSRETSGVEGLEGKIRKVAMQIRIAQWAKAQGYADTREFHARFEQRKNQVLTRAYIKDLDRGTSPTESELRACFQNAPSQFILPEQRTVTEIFLPLPRQDLLTSDPAAYSREVLTRRQAMNQLRQRVTSGIPIAQAIEEAGALSQELRVIDRGTQPEGPRGRVLDLAVASLRAGEWSGIEQTQRGFRLFLLRAIQAPRARSFEEAREDVVRVWELSRRQKLERDLYDRIFQETLPQYDEEALEQFHARLDQILAD